MIPVLCMHCLKNFKYIKWNVYFCSKIKKKIVQIQQNICIFLVFFRMIVHLTKLVWWHTQKCQPSTQGARTISLAVRTKSPWVSHLGRALTLLEECPLIVVLSNKQEALGAICSPELKWDTFSINQQSLFTRGLLKESCCQIILKSDSWFLTRKYFRFSIWICKTRGPMVLSCSPEFLAYTEI